MNQADLYIPRNALNGIVTVGNFDGVHRGHQRMLETLCRIAAENSAPAVVVTFDPHPLSLLRPDSPLPRLTTISRRTELLKQYGAGEVVVLPVTHHLLQMSADEFFRDILVQRLAAAGIVEGPNFRFGRDRQGNVQSLSRMCLSEGIAFSVIEAVNDEGYMISSSRIRTLLSQGQVLEAVAMTGHPHRLSGTVTRGAGRGRRLGFPTANLDDITVMLPGDGVYAGTTTVDETLHVVAISIGPNPTFDDHRIKVECFLDGFDGDLYGQQLDIDVLCEIRPLCSFGSVDKLTQQIQSDVEQCRIRVQQLTTPIYKICRESDWTAAVANGRYAGSAVDEEDGFIHFSTARQMQETAARHFAGQTDLMLVEFAPANLGPALKWEASRGGDLFPHLYGRLRPADAVRVYPLPWKDGRHEFPAGTTQA
jgi:riboflavin kinase/FMN adenylyltransferase